MTKENQVTRLNVIRQTIRDRFKATSLADLFFDDDFIRIDTDSDEKPFILIGNFDILIEVSDQNSEWVDITVLDKKCFTSTTILETAFLILSYLRFYEDVYPEVRQMHANDLIGPWIEKLYGK